MKHSQRNGLSLSQAVDGFLLNLAARRLSVHTVADYTNSLSKLQCFLGADPPVAGITVDQLAAFMADLATPRAPAGVAARPAQPLSKKTCKNIHTGLSAFWTWLTEQGYAREHLLRLIERPRAERRAVSPLEEGEIRALLGVCERSRTCMRPGKRLCDHSRPTGVRDRAIVLLLVDTGMRATELCQLELRHVDLKLRRIMVYGKGDKERILPVSPATGRALWQYVVTERKGARLNEPLFLGLRGAALTRSGLLQLVQGLGERAGVADVHPHRFRHTFAINFLRNGGGAYELQLSLGHESMEMVRVYLSLASSDLAAAHAKASPVTAWRLK